MSNKLFATAISIVLSSFPCAGFSQNGITESEFSYYEMDPYVDCLGEGIEINVTITARSHVVFRPNGGIHVVDNWFMEAFAEGLSTGHQWFARVAGPYTWNANGAQSTEGWNVTALYDPLDGGQKFRRSNRFHVVFDANGMAHVERGGPFQYKCIGREN